MEFPSPPCVCPYPKVSGSIVAALVAGFLVALIPMFFVLFTTYGVSLESLQYIPQSLFTQLGTVFGYYSSDGLIGFLYVVFIGAVIGMMAGSPSKALLSAVIFLIADVAVFVFFGLMVLGESLDYSRFAIFGQWNAIMMVLSFMIPAVITSGMVQRLVRPTILPSPLKINLH